MIYDKSKLQKIEISLFEISSKIPKYLVHFGKQHFEVSTAVANLIIVLQQSNTTQDAVNVYKERYDKIYSEEELELLIDKYISPIIDSQRKETNSFLFKKELVSSQFINIFSDLLKVLFNKRIVLPLLFFVFLLEFFFFSNQPLAQTSHSFDLYTFIGLFLFFISSSFVHELGHASACRYFEVEHGGVGLGLYLNFPVFYTDVSNIWKLPRKQRLLVNFAGVYFQLLLLIPLLLLYIYTYSSLLKYFILVVNLNFLITLNPFLKFDGYWIMSDLLGVPNLRKRTTELFVYFFYKIRRNGEMEKPFLLTMKKKEKLFMFIYSLITNCFFAYYFLYILPLFLYDFMKTFPINTEKLVFEIAQGHMPSYQLMQVVLIKLFFFALTIYLLVRTVLSIIHKLKFK